MNGEEMAGTNELQSSDGSFVWDDQSQLYFHASSGFYHDPNAGWYYSSRDGLYYKFENGNYVLLESHEEATFQVNHCEMHSWEGTVTDNPVQNQPCSNVNCDGEESHWVVQGDDSGNDEQLKNVVDGPTSGQVEVNTDQESENPRPPSEWLEDTLIDLYLSGYKVAVNAAADATGSLETDDRDGFKLSTSGSIIACEMEEGEWIPEDYSDLTDSSEKVSNEGISMDEEENWRAQYGQVIHTGEEPVPEFPVVDLWDWAMVTGLRKDQKRQVARLIGRLVKQSAKVHPSMPSGRTLLKTAPICEARLDLVRVTTGQVYKLRNPSAKYLASLSSYDSSDPTKDWGFPELSFNCKTSPKSKLSHNNKSKVAGGAEDPRDLSVFPDQLSASVKHKSHAYRDRAAERRKLHGGFGVGPGQKSLVVDDDDDDDSTSIDDAASEALNMSFGAGSYARRILEGMGWKEGEALGSTRKGLTEPLQPVGHVGSAGLGWPQSKHR